MHTADWSAVVPRFVALFLVVGAGWLARRRGWFGPETTVALGRLSVELAFPCLTFTQMLRTLGRENLAASWPEFALGCVILLVAGATGALLAWRVEPSRKATVTFLVGMPNWIFLPLPVAAALCGDAGVRVVLLVNVPMQVILWTAGVALLQGGLRGAHSLRALLTNPGLVATAAGAAASLLWPSSATWHEQPVWAASLVQTLSLVGAMTIPLSLLVTGAQLAELERAPASVRVLPVTLAGRLLVAPLLTLPLLVLARRWLPVAPETALVVQVIAAMPIAVSCGVFVDRFGGDRQLTARAISLSTVLSLGTVPVFLYLAARFLR